MGVEAFLAHWGIAAVFAGAMIEGESFVIGGGELAQRGLFPLWQVIAAAFVGSVAMDQLCFAAGRCCRDHRWVRAIRGRRAAKAAMDFVERHPDGYIFAFRYLYGLRIVSPLAIGLTRIAPARFLAINALSAAVWAALFAALGHVAGNAIEGMFGRVHSALLLLGFVVLLAGTTAALAHRFIRARRIGPERRRFERVTNAGVPTGD